MDSLLASYASSDDEEQQPQESENQQNSLKQQGEIRPPPKSGGLFASLPPPKPSSPFLSLPPPKTQPPNRNKFLGNDPGTVQRTQASDVDDDDDEPELIKFQNPKVSLSDSQRPSTLFSSIPQPKSSVPESKSLFSSLPLPKAKNEAEASILPNPVSTLGSNVKKVVQFRPPVVAPAVKAGWGVDDVDDEEDDDEKERERRKIKETDSIAQTPSVTSFLSSIPAPRNSSTLGALPSASGSGRRSILQTDVPSSYSPGATGDQVAVSSNVENYGDHTFPSSSATSDGVVDSSYGYRGGGPDANVNWSSGSENYGSYQNYSTSYASDAYVSYSNWGEANADYSHRDASNSGYEAYGHYPSNAADVSAPTVVSEMSVSAESSLRFPGKRGRNDAPPQIVEVKQEELIKNRPREDQVKLTGIAFGPAYQPVSNKGKPSKLHKRKHQIGSLFFDMKQKEMELAERRARGFLTKAQTQGKYGW